MKNNYQKRSYKTLFALLESLYFETENDAVGTLLGSMNPELFLEVDSADPAVFEDFCDCLNNCFVKTSKEDEQTAYLASMQFLLLYKNEFGYDIGVAEQYIDYDKFKEEFLKH